MTKKQRSNSNASHLEELKNKERPHKYWHNLENVLYSVRKVSDEIGHFPTQLELKNYYGINNAISKYHGGLLEVRKKAGYGEPGEKPAGYWQEWKNTQRELKKAIRENNGEFPSQKYLTLNGLSSLSVAISKYFGGFRKVREQMGFEVGTQNPELLKDFKWVSKQIKRITKDNHGEFPTNPRLKELERYDLTWAIYKYHGGINAVREKMGYRPIQSSPGAFKDWKTVYDELRSVIRENDGEFPSESHLREIGRGDIAHAINKYHGGVGKAQVKMGFQLKQRPRGQLKGWEYVESELRKRMKDNNGRFPSQKFLIKNGEGSLVAAIQNYHGGMMAVRKKLGVEYDQNPYGTLQSWDWLEQQLKEIIDKNDGELPSYTALTKMGRHDIKHSIGKYHGGFNIVRKKLGYEPLQISRGLARDWKWLSSELEKVIIQNKDEFPSLTRLSELDRNDIVGAMGRYHGGVNKVRKRMGYDQERNTPDQLSDWKWMQNQLKTIIKGNKNEFPTQGYLAKKGRTDLTNAIGKYHGGFNAIRQRMGYELKQMPKGYLQDWANIESDLKRIIKKLGHFPSSKELEKLGKSSIAYGIIKYHGGIRKAKEMLGLQQARKENNWWKDIEIVISQAKEAMRKLNYDILPAQKVLSSEGFGYLNSAINYHGGFTEFRELLKERNGQPTQKNELETLLKNYAGGAHE